VEHRHGKGAAEAAQSGMNSFGDVTLSVYNLHHVVSPTGIIISTAASGITGEGEMRAALVGEPWMSGWVHIQGWAIETWATKWVQLRTMALVIFEDSYQLKNPLGFISLEKVKDIIFPASNVKEKPSPFTLITRERKVNMSSDSDSLKWVNLLKSLKFFIKPRTYS